MTFAAGIFGTIGICVFATVALLIVAAWREDREGREDRRERLSDLQLDESAAGRSISLAPEWDPLADLLEDVALRRD